MFITATAWAQIAFIGVLCAAGVGAILLILLAGHRKRIGQVVERDPASPPAVPDAMPSEPVRTGPSEDVSARQVRQAGVRNLMVAGVWFLLAAAALQLGFFPYVNSVCMWPARALQEASTSGFGKGLASFVGALGTLIFLVIISGWLLPLPSSVYMVATGRRSKTLEKYFPVTCQPEQEHQSHAVGRDDAGLPPAR